MNDLNPNAEEFFDVTDALKKEIAKFFAKWVLALGMICLVVFHLAYLPSSRLRFIEIALALVLFSVAIFIFKNPSGFLKITSCFNEVGWLAVIFGFWIGFTILADIFWCVFLLFVAVAICLIWEDKTLIFPEDMLARWTGFNLAIILGGSIKSGLLVSLFYGIAIYAMFVILLFIAIYIMLCYGCSE